MGHPLAGHALLYFIQTFIDLKTLPRPRRGEVCRSFIVISSTVTHEPITLKNGSLVRWKPLEASPDNPKIPHPFSGDKQVCIYIS
jgi:hypothetical protein